MKDTSTLGIAVQVSLFLTPVIFNIVSCKAPTRDHTQHLTHLHSIHLLGQAPEGWNEMKYIYWVRPQGGDWLHRGPRVAPDGTGPRELPRPPEVLEDPAPILGRCVGTGNHVDGSHLDRTLPAQLS
jgi:hypothetical protein